MKKKLLKRQAIIVLFFVFTFFVGVFTAQAQASFDPQEEAAGNYEEASITSRIEEEDPSWSQTTIGNVVVQKSTAHTGKFKITLPNEYIKGGNVTNATISNIVLDGVTINDNGSIPVQDIKTNAETKHTKNGITFSVLPNSRIIKDTSDPDWTKYYLQLFLRTKTEVIVKGGFFQTYKYHVKLSYINGSRRVVSETGDQTLGSYPGRLDWKMTGDGQGEGDLRHRIDVERGTQEGTYKLVVPAFKIDAQYSATINSFSIDNLVVDADGNYGPRKVNVSGSGPMGISISPELTVTGNLKDKHLYMHGVSDFGVSVPVMGTYKLSLDVKFNGSKLPPNAPAMVTDLKAVADENNELKATLSFNAPTKTFSGKNLTELNTIEIYRNEEEDPIHTITDAVVGEAYTWTDETVERGENSYRVVGINSKGTGPAASVSVFVGRPIVPVEARNIGEYFGYLDCKLATEQDGLFHSIKVSAGDEEGAYKLRMEDFKIETANDVLFFEPIEIPALELDGDGNFISQEISITVVVKEDTLSANLSLTGSLKHPKLVLRAVGELTISDNAKALELEFNGEKPYDAAPGLVTDLTAVDATEADNVLKAKLSFNAPEKDNSGEDLTSFSAIEIYRNNERIAVHTITEGLETGKAYTWTDENAKQGRSVYRVVAKNIIGAGEPAYVPVRVGTDAPLIDSNSFGVYDGDLNWKILVKGQKIEGDLEHSVTLSKGTQDGTYKLVMPAFKIEAAIPADINEIEVDNLEIDADGNFIPQTVKVKGEALGMEVEPELRISGSLKRPKLVMKGVGSFSVSIPDMGDFDVNLSVVFNGEKPEGSAPALVTELQAVADENYLPKATLSFILPDKNNLGEDLTELTAIKIYRTVPIEGVEEGTEENQEETEETVEIPIDTITEGLELGKPCTWVDENAPEGEVIYKVVAVNNGGESLPVSVSVFIGKPFVPDQNPGEYIGILAWNIAEEGEGELVHSVTVSEGTKEGTYKLMMPVFNIKGKYSVEINTIVLDNVQPDADGKFVIEEQTDISGKGDLNTALTAKVKIKGSMQDSKLHIIGSGSFVALEKTYELSFEFNGDKPGASSPDMVTDLTVVDASENGSFKATLSFKAPTNNQILWKLKELSLIEIFRNNEKTAVHTITEELELGKEYIWLDETPQAGTNTYTVIAHSAKFGAGWPASVSIFLGDAPLINTENFGTYSGKLEWELPSFQMKDTLNHSIVISEGTEPGTYKLLMPTFTIKVTEPMEVTAVINDMVVDNLIIDAEGNFIPQTVEVTGSAMGMVVSPKLEITGSLKDAKLVMKAAGSFNAMGMDVALDVVFNGEDGDPEVPVITGIDNLLDKNNVQIYSAEGSIVIEGAKGEILTIYSVEGRLIASFAATGSERVPVTQGIYIVRVGEKTEKLLVP